MDKNITNGLPPYTLRKSSRAKYLQLKITAQGELQLVVPKRVSVARANAFLLAQRDWIQKNAPLLSIPQKIAWPASVFLRAIDCEWSIFLCSQAARSRYCEHTQGLKVYLREQTLAHFKQVMARWLKQKAVLEFTPWMQRLSASCGLRYRNLSFRGQKTVWGSCSKTGEICLNYKLLFLPSEYVEYVMIHELCHLVHFDHSKKFWQLVATYLGDWQRLRASVKRADNLLPQWIKA